MTGLNAAMTTANGIAAATALIFVVWYGFTRPWWRTPVGQALIIKAGAISVALIASLALRIDYYLDGQFSWETPIKIAVTLSFLGVAASYVVWIILLGRGDDEK